MPQQGFSFAGIRGVQAGMEYYVCMVPLALLPRLFVFSDSELPPDVRAQRSLNKARITEIRDYILNNPSSYAFSALTASVDAKISFIPASTGSDDSQEPSTAVLGCVSVPFPARFLINDGQHRKAAIEAAIKKNPRLQYEHISIVLYEDMGLKRSQQIFSDLNRYAIRPTKSLNILYDNRDDFSSQLCRLVEEMPMFKGWVEKERGTISNRSTALFTLSGLFHGTQNLIYGIERPNQQETERLIRSFWEAVYRYIPEWQDIISQRQKSAELRRLSVCAHTIALLALGNLGNYMFKKYNGWEGLERLSYVDWTKSNNLWRGQVVIDNKISGTRASTKFLSDTLIRITEEKRSL